MVNLFQKFLLYAKLPEMRLFWYFLPLIIAIFAIEISYLPSLVLWFSAGFFIFLAVIILVNNLRLARSNLEVKIERNELTSVIATLRDGVIAYDSNFKILIFNKAAEQIFNLKQQEVVGINFTPEKIKEPRLKIFSQVLFPSLAPSIIKRTEAGIYPQVVDISLKEPAVMELRVITNKIIDPAGNLLGFVKITRDRTREVEVLRSKSEFITIATHQLRTPLTSIHWVLENLSKDHLSESQQQMNDVGLAASSYMVKVIDDLFGAFQMEEGKFGYNFEKVKLIEFVGQIMEKTKELYAGLGLKIYFQKPDEEIEITADPKRLKTVFANILDNAAKYNVKNGEIIVAMERMADKPYLQVSVRDTGIGIEQSDIQKLFTKFFRGANAMKVLPTASGLGLYMAGNIIKRHGGEIWAESEINRGTTIYFTLPIDPALIPPKEIVYGEE